MWLAVMRSVLQAALFSATSLLLIPGLLAQEPTVRASSVGVMPSGIVRGHLLFLRAGTAEVERDDGITYDCTYDSHTLFERNHWPVQAADLNRGEPVEVLSDRRPGTRACYVRILSVIYLPPPPLRRPTKIAPLDDDNQATAQTTQPKTPVRARQGNLSFSGVVTQYDGSTLTLRTRSGNQVLHVRTDTLYSNSGLTINPPIDLVNEHVYVRAGRNIYGIIEAYQVLWGEILNVQ
jgi:hypothetical protein